MATVEITVRHPATVDDVRALLELVDRHLLDPVVEIGLQRLTIAGTVRLDEPIDPPVAVEIAEVRTCWVCGCTDDGCTQCVEATGEPCGWALDDLCTRCADETVNAVTDELRDDVEPDAELLDCEINVVYDPDDPDVEISNETPVEVAAPVDTSTNVAPLDERVTNGFSDMELIELVGLNVDTSMPINKQIIALTGRPTGSVHPIKRRCIELGLIPPSAIRTARD